MYIHPVRRQLAEQIAELKLALPQPGGINDADLDLIEYVRDRYQELYRDLLAVLPPNDWRDRCLDELESSAMFAVKSVTHQHRRAQTAREQLDDIYAANPDADVV